MILKKIEISTLYFPRLKFGQIYGRSNFGDAKRNFVEEGEADELYFHLNSSLKELIKALPKSGFYKSIQRENKRQYNSKKSFKTTF